MTHLVNNFFSQFFWHEFLFFLTPGIWPIEHVKTRFVKSGGSDSVDCTDPQLSCIMVVHLLLQYFFYYFLLYFLLYFCSFQILSACTDPQLSCIMVVHLLIVIGSKQLSWIFHFDPSSISSCFPLHAIFNLDFI